VTPGRIDNKISLRPGWYIRDTPLRILHSERLCEMAGSIFVTGANGFVGRRLLSLLGACPNRRIICLGRSKPSEIQPKNVEFVLGDLLDSRSYAEALAGCDTVIHLAAATGKHAPKEYFRVNRDGSQSLIAAAQQGGVQRFMHVSTIAVKFGNKSHYHYAQSKEQAEMAVKQSSLHWTIARPTMIFGKGSTVLDGLSRLATLPMVPVFGDGLTPVQPILADDLAASLVAALEDESLIGRTVEIGGPDVVSIENLLLGIRYSAGRTSAPIIHLPARPIAACLGLFEPWLRPLLPITAGQLASFTNPGTISPDPWVEARQAGMKRVDEMLRYKQ
jgi:nucleoside-diphosphate-sugar epimerase